MIPKTVRNIELLGKYVTLDQEISNGAGTIAPAGTKCLVINSSNRGIELSSERCPSCNRQLYVYGVKRGEISLWDEEQPAKIKIRKTSGRKVILQEAYETKGGMVAAEGTKCTIVGTTAHGYTLQTDPCPICGMQLYMRDVPRSIVEPE